MGRTRKYLFWLLLDYCLLSRLQIARSDFVPEKTIRVCLFPDILSSRVESYANRADLSWTHAPLIYYECANTQTTLRYETENFSHSGLLIRIWVCKICCDLKYHNVLSAWKRVFLKLPRPRNEVKGRNANKRTNERTNEQTMSSVFRHVDSRPNNSFN